MIGWHPIAVAALTVAGLGCCGIATICLAAGSMVGEDYHAADRRVDGGVQFGFIGLACLAAAFGVRFL